MNALFASGAILDWIIAAMVVEGASLVLLWRLRGIGVAPATLLWNLASGLCLILAMRLALGGAGWPTMSAALLAALVFHLADLRRLWH